MNSRRLDRLEGRFGGDRRVTFEIAFRPTDSQPRSTPCGRPPTGGTPRRVVPSGSRWTSARRTCGESAARLDRLEGLP